MQGAAPRAEVGSSRRRGNTIDGPSSPEPLGRLVVAADLGVARPAAESPLQTWSARLDIGREHLALYAANFRYGRLEEARVLREEPPRLFADLRLALRILGDAK